MIFRVIQISGLAAVLTLSGAYAQKNGVVAKPTPPASQRPAAQVRSAIQSPAKQQKAPQVSAAAIANLDRWNRMPKDQREKALAKLPPERQKAVRERLARWNSMSPQEQERLRTRYERFSHLTVDNQALVRRQIQSFARLPDDRRPRVSKEFDDLRRLPDNERRARMNSEEFRSRFTPKEQEILRDLAGNMAIPTRNEGVQAGR